MKSTLERELKKYVKLLKGKRLQPDLSAGDQPPVLGGALVRDQASIGSGGRTKALGM